MKFQMGLLGGIGRDLWSSRKSPETLGLEMHEIPQRIHRVFPELSDHNPVPILHGFDYHPIDAVTTSLRGRSRSYLEVSLPNRSDLTSTRDLAHPHSPQSSFIARFGRLVCRPAHLTWTLSA